MSRWSPDEQRKLLLESIADYAIAMLTPEGIIESWNRGGEQIFGYSEEEALGKHFGTLYPEVSQGEAALREAREQGRSEEEGWRVRKDGSRLWANSTLTAVRADDGELIGFAKVTRDLTERRSGENQARLSEERFRLMVDSVRDYAIFMLEPDGRVATWNAGAERIKGYRSHEIIGQHFSKFYPREDIDSGKPPLELRVAASEGRFEDEGWRLRKDGTRFWANVIITALRDSASNKLIGFVKVTRDLTERRRTEEERVRLAQAEEAVRLRDEFLSIASHELKTPLTAMQLQLQSLRRKVEQHDEVLASRVTRATRSGDRLADLIEALLDVSRIATGRFELRRETFDLATSMRDVVDRMRESATQAGCELSVNAPGPLTGAWDRLRLEQVLVNLLSNAFKYGAGARVDVSLSQQAGDAVLRVRDFGPGVAAVGQDRIFGRFERAVSMRHFGGMGLGLYVTRQIVDAHGGSVAAANAAEGGAIFTVRLPLTAEAQQSRGELH
ncbi:MAG: PAS domain S-box protein [Myxococcales bacterium]